MRPDVRDFRSPSLQLLVISGFEKVFQFGHHLVELLDRVVPLLGIKVVKGFVIVAAEFLFGFSLELGQFSPIPEADDWSAVRRSARRRTDLELYFQP